MFNKNTFSSPRFHPLKVLFFIGVFIAIATALSWLVMFLWNAILPETVGVQPLNFWKAAGLLLLSKILFGGFGRGGGRGKGKGWGHHKSGNKHSWKNKWMSMDDDERKEAKTRWKEYCNRRNVDKE